MLPFKEIRGRMAIVFETEGVHCVDYKFKRKDGASEYKTITVSDGEIESQNNFKYNNALFIKVE